MSVEEINCLMALAKGKQAERKVSRDVAHPPEVINEVKKETILHTEKPTPSKNTPVKPADATCLVWDTGIGTAHVERLSQDVKRCLYFTPWQLSSPLFRNYAKGLDMKKVEKILYFFNHVDDADVVFFPDVGSGDVANYLRNKGKAVYSAGLGEVFEHERAKLHEFQEKLGLPTQKYEKVTGVSSLISYLKKNPKRFVKTDIFRGDIETFFAEDYDSVAILIDQLAAKLGPFRDDYEFIVEEPVKNTIGESGFDLFFNGTAFQKPYLWGFEDTHAYIGKVTDKLPPFLQNTLEKITPTLSKLGYRGSFSTEELYVTPERSYLLDVTARFPYPLSNAFTEFYKNYSDAMIGTAFGQTVALNPQATYMGCLPIFIKESADKWTRVSYDPKVEKFIKASYGTRIDGSIYLSPDVDATVSVIAWGDTPEDVANKLVENGEKVKAYGMWHEHSALDRIMQSIEKANEAGVKF